MAIPTGYKAVKGKKRTYVGADGKEITFKNNAELSAWMASGGSTTTETKKDNNQVTEPNKEEITTKTKSDVEASMNAGKDIAKDLVKTEDFGKVNEGRTQEEVDSLAKLKAEQERAATRTPEAQEAMDRFKAGLEGLNSQEGMALQEQARRNLDSQYQTQMAQAKMAAARSGARGAAAGAQQMILDRDRARAQGQLEQDLTVQNYGIKQQALQNFGGFVNATDAGEAQRRQQALQMYTNQGNVLTDRDLERSKFNIGQTQAEAMARLQATLGGAGVYASTQGSNYANNIALQNVNQTLKLQQEQLKQANEANQAWIKAQNNYYPSRSGGSSQGRPRGRGDGRTNPNQATTTTPVK